MPDHRPKRRHQDLKWASSYLFPRSPVARRQSKAPGRFKRNTGANPYSSSLPRLARRLRRWFRRDYEKNNGLARDVFKKAARLGLTRDAGKPRRRPHRRFLGPDVAPPSDRRCDVSRTALSNTQEIGVGQLLAALNSPTTEGGAIEQSAGPYVPVPHRDRVFSSEAKAAIEAAREITPCDPEQLSVDSLRAALVAARRDHTK
jgi:hypothetical protein